MSAGTQSGLWSPSRGKVIFVPSFHPFLTSIFKIFSSNLTWLLTSITFFVILIFLEQPVNISSKLTNNSFSIGASWTFCLLWFTNSMGSSNSPPIPWNLWLFISPIPLNPDRFSNISGKPFEPEFPKTLVNVLNASPLLNVNVW